MQPRLSRDYGDAGMAGVGHPLGPARVLPQAYAMASNLVGAVAVVTFAIMLFGAVPAARQGVAYAAAAASDRELASIHILRLLAIGTIIKYLQRQRRCTSWSGGPCRNFLFAASAIAVALWAGQGILSREFLIGWHTIGFLVFFGAGISMFLFHALTVSSLPCSSRRLHRFQVPDDPGSELHGSFIHAGARLCPCEADRRGLTSLTCWADRRSSSAGPPSRPARSPGLANRQRSSERQPQPMHSVRPAFSRSSSAMRSSIRADHWRERRPVPPARRPPGGASRARRRSLRAKVRCAARTR